VRSGFVTLVGRPNVGKSTLLNALVGRKVSIVSDKPQTTRTAVRGIVTRPDAQLVFVDTPGLHKAVSALGEKVNATALGSTTDVDVTCLVVDATQPIGTGDEWVASHVDMSRCVVVVNKVDVASREQVLAQLGRAAKFGAESYFPVSASTGEGIDALLAHLCTLVPEGDLLYPPEMVSETNDVAWVGELVREVLLEKTSQELPYSIATRATVSDEGAVHCEIVVERESQKGMVIGKGGSMLKAIRRAVKPQLPAGLRLELSVVVDKNWQQRADRVERLGY
jgi:GTP-binding protein Era